MLIIYCYSNLYLYIISAKSINVVYIEIKKKLLIYVKNNILDLEIGKHMESNLSREQRLVVKEILEAIKMPKDRAYCFYLDGPGGTGKTYTYKTIYYLLTSQGYKVCNMASTAIAAILLPHGQTIHSRFKVDVPTYSDSQSRILPNTKLAQIIQDCDVIIWDEAPMSSRYVLEIVEEKLRELMPNEFSKIPFGGKIMLLGGDFRQCLPIQRNANRSEKLDLSIKSSCLWPNFKIFQLKINQRIREGEQAFDNFLRKVIFLY
jgi:hypothetical protein